MFFMLHRTMRRSKLLALEGGLWDNTNLSVIPVYVESFPSDSDRKDLLFFLRTKAKGRKVTVKCVRLPV